MRITLKKDKIINGSAQLIGSEITVPDDVAEEMIAANEAIPYSSLPELEDENFSKLLDDVLPPKKNKAKK